MLTMLSLMVPCSVFFLFKQSVEADHCWKKENSPFHSQTLVHWNVVALDSGIMKRFRQSCLWGDYVSYCGVSVQEAIPSSSTSLNHYF